MSAMILTRRWVAIATLVVLGGVVMYWALRPGVPDFSRFPAGAERKEVFFNYLLPLIEQRNDEIRETREQLRAWRQGRDDIGWWDAWTLEDLAEDYRLTDFDVDSDADWRVLLKRVDVVPPSLALAQAANESAWGTARFTREGNNFYGQWCFEAGCGIVPTNRDAGKRHEVADFDSPEASIESYIHNLNSHRAYKPLRDIRARLRAADEPITGIALAAGLGQYSERGDEYINELRSMIRFNGLTQYDGE